jgi:hypothetical protein
MPEIAPQKQTREPTYSEEITVEQLPSIVLAKAIELSLPLTEIRYKIGHRQPELDRYFFQVNGATIDCISVNFENGKILE